MGLRLGGSCSASILTGPSPVGALRQVTTSTPAGQLIVQSPQSPALALGRGFSSGHFSEQMIGNSRHLAAINSFLYQDFTIWLGTY